MLCNTWTETSLTFTTYDLKKVLFYRFFMIINVFAFCVVSASQF